MSPMVMEFGQSSRPSTITTLMNMIFHEELDEFVIVYIDDIFVFFKTAKKHVKHLEVVL